MTGCSPYRLELRRLDHNKATLGTLTLYKLLEDETEEVVFNCDTLELAWKENERNVSCIPYGDYAVTRRRYGGYKECYEKRWGHPYSLEVFGVKGRGDILIHCGNYAKDTRGCILVGIKIDIGFIGQSRKTYRRMWEHLETAFEACDKGTAMPVHIPLHICNGVCFRFLTSELDGGDFSPEKRATMIL